MNKLKVEIGMNRIKQKVILNYFLFQLDKSTGTHYNIKRSKYGEVAQLARAPGSYPKAIDQSLTP